MSAADLEKEKKKQMIAILEAVKEPKVLGDAFNIFREGSDTSEVTLENFVKVINQLVPSISKDEILPILQDYKKPDQEIVNYGLFLENLNKIKQKKKGLTDILEQIVDKSESKIQDLFDLFASVDTNKNGFISRKEFLNMFNDFGIYYDEDQIDDFFFFLDTNSDNQLSYKELQKYNTNFIKNKDPNRAGPGMEKTSATDEKQTKKPEDKASSTSMATFTQDEMADIEKTLQMIAKFMKEHRLDFERVFYAMDCNGDGTITENDLTAVLSSLKIDKSLRLDLLVKYLKNGRTNIDLKTFKKHLNQDDNNGANFANPDEQKPSSSANERNNGVPRDEKGERAFYLFKEALRRQRIEPKKAFEIFDRNRNGTIEFSEFYHALELLGADLEAEEKNYIFRKLDIKANGRIERDDFLRCFETGPSESNNDRNEMASYNVSEARGSYYQPQSPERQGWKAIVAPLKRTKPEDTRATTNTYKSLKEVLISQRINPEEAYRNFDRHHEGYFGFPEFSMGLERFSIKLDLSDIRAMFSELDIQRKNRVSRSEFLQYFETTSHKEHDDNSRAGDLLKGLIRQIKLQAGHEPLDVFRLMDRQRSGQVDFNDFQRFVLDIYHRFTRDEVMSIFRLIDENKDGLIFFEEFKKHFSDNQPESGKISSIPKFKVKLGLNSREKILETWRSLDANVNKSITQKEFGIGIKRISSDFSDSELDQIFRELAGGNTFTQDELAQIEKLLSQVAEFMKEDKISFEKLFVSKDEHRRGVITERDFKTVLCNDLKIEQGPKLDLMTKYLTNEQGNINLGTLQKRLNRQAEEASLVLTADQFLEKLSRINSRDADHASRDSYPNNREPRRTFTRDEMAQIEKMFEEIAKFMRVDRLSFDRLFTSKDYRRTGTITERDFKNILVNELCISENPTLGLLAEFVKTRDGNIDLAILKRHLNLDQGQASRGSANQFDHFVKALKQRFNSPADMMRFFDPDNTRYINKRAFVLCCQRGLDIDQEAALSYFAKLDPRNKGEISVNDLRDAIENEGRTKGAYLPDQTRGRESYYRPPETNRAALGHDSYYGAARGSYGSRPRDRRDRGRNNEEALAMYDRILSANPNDSEASYGKGLVLLDIGRREDGMKSIARAIELDPKNAEFFNTKGEKLLEEGQFKEAVDAYDQAIKLDPKHLIAYSNKGFALYKLGKIEEAIKLYDKQLELNPDDWASFAKKGQALHDQNKISEAKEYFEKAMTTINAGELEGNLFTPLNGRTILLNTLELELIASIKELFKLPNLQPNQAPSAKLKHAIQDANNKKEALKLKLINAAYDSKQDSSKENEVETLQRELADLKRMFSRLAAELEEVKADLRDSGIRELAEVKRGFRELEDKDPELLAYCKTFYWTAINLFGAYRALSSGVIKGNLSGEETNTDSLLAKGLKAATSALSNVAQGVPFAGGVLGLIDSVVDGIFEAVKENRLENKVNAINKIIQAKLGTEDDISLNVSKVALAMTRVKEQAILYPDIPAPCSSKVKAGLQWLEEKVDKIKDKVLPSIELHDKDSHGAVLALQDVALFMAFMYKSHESIIKRKEKLDKQLESIVKYGGLDQLLENMSDIPSDKELAHSRSSCCTMF